MEKIITIIGQTSSGKSDLAIELAKTFNGEIVSADSRQVYKGLDWCSGKVTKEEIKMVPHHLIDVVDLGTQYNLFNYQNDAYAAIENILKKGKVPFIVGGTGLYSRAIVEGYNLVQEKPDNELRDNLDLLSKDELLKICKKNNIHIEGEITSRRMIRLIELAGKKKIPNNPKFDVLQIGIYWDREEIYERIKLRLQKRMPFMIEEIKNLLLNGVSEEFLIKLGLEAKYIVKFLNKEFDSYEYFFEELLKEERHFAKRQKTWYNKEKNVVWLDAKDDILNKSTLLISKFLGNK